MFRRIPAILAVAGGLAASASANGPVTVEEAVENALESNPKLLEMSAGLDAATAAAAGVWSRYMPEISVHAGLQRNEVRGVAGESVTEGGIVGGATSTSRSFGDSDTRFRAGISLEQFLFDIGGFTGTLRARGLDTLAALSALESARLDVASEVRVAYWTAAERQAFYEHRHAMVDRYGRRVEEMPGTGFGREEARLDLAREQAALLAAERSLAEANIDLRGGFGEREEPPRELASRLVVPSVQVSLERSVETALRELPGLGRLRALEKVAEAELEAARAALLPAMSAFLGVHSETPVTSSALNQLTILSGGVLLRVPTAGAFTRARLDEARAVVSRAKAKTRSEESRVRKEVEKRYTALFDAVARARMAEQTVAMAEAHLDQVSEAARRGRADFRTSGEALRHFDEAEAARLQALLEAQRSHARLDRSLGRLF